MKIRKSMTAIGAALMMVGISAPAMADGFSWDDGVCGDADLTSAELKRLSEYLRCDDDRYWINDGDDLVDPIWEKAGSEERGCEVHESLADKLWVEPSPDDGNSGNRGKGPKNFAEGAAQKVVEGKYDEAVTKLMQLLTAVDKSKPNSDFSEGGYVGAEALSNGLLNMIELEAIPCVNKLLQPQP